MKRTRDEWVEWILNSAALHEVVDMRENGWAATRIQQALEGMEQEATDWRKALAWYMFHVYHSESVTFVEGRSPGHGMACMPPEMRDAILEVFKEHEEQCKGGMRKPDGSEY